MRKHLLAGLVLLLSAGVGQAQTSPATNDQANARYNSVLNQLGRQDLIMSPRVNRLIGWPGPSVSGLSDADQLDILLNGYWDWVMQTQPEWATFLGYPGQNSRWSELTPQALQALQALEQRSLQLAEQIDTESLDEQRRLNLELFLFQLRGSVRGHAFPTDLMPVDAMNGVQAGMSQVLGAMPLQTPNQRDDYLQRVQAIPTLLAQTRSLMEQGLKQGITPPRATLHKVAAQIRALNPAEASDSPLMRPLFQALGDDPRHATLRDQARAVYLNEVRPAVAAFASYFEEDYLPNTVTATGLETLPDGEAWYAWRVSQMTTLELSAEQIHQIGLDEVARIRAAMQQAMADAGFKGKDITAFARHLSRDKRNFYTQADDLLRDYRALAKQADAALPRLFSRYPSLPYAVEPVPAFLAAGQPVAYYLPGSSEGGRPGTFFVNTSTLEDMPRYEMQALLLHEAVPGHHFQIALAQEQGDLPDFRRNAYFTAYIEGWGLYAESLGEEIGFYTTPQERFGALTFEMWRAVRLVVDTGLHAMGWSRQQAIDYFQAQTGHGLDRVTTEVDRYLVMPGQALAYKMGQLKITELRRRAESALGEAFDVRAFHDAVLAQGALPLPVLEARIEAWISQQQDQAS